MRYLTWLIVSALAVALTVPVVAQEKGGVDVTGPYDIVPNWLKPVEEGRIIHPVTVFAETPDRVFIGLTGTSPTPPTSVHLTTFDPKFPGAKVNHQLYIVDRNGNLVEEWSQWSDLFGSLHKVAINPYDPERHIWVIDRSSQQVFEFTHDGKKLVMSQGEKKVAGIDDQHFGRPTDIAWLPDGTFFVSDGYDNTRVVKFDNKSNFLTAWGTKGKGPGQFNLVHSIAIDSKRRIYVVDRINARIQIYDENGKYLDEWDNFISPTRIQISQDQYAWVLDGANGANRILKYDLNGQATHILGYAGKFSRGYGRPPRLQRGFRE